MLDGSWRCSTLDFCAVYYTTQLVRCAAFSFVLIGLVMLLRKIFFSERAFFRGMLWAAFLIIPFLGRLKLFYENAAVWRVTAWMIGNPGVYLWVSRIYMAGMVVTAVCIWGKRLRLRRIVAKMEKVSAGNIWVSVTDMMVTPFTTGLLRPVIVLPRVMLDSYDREERAVILQHEQTHIRLGHLWWGLAWDMLRCLLWINPFLSICQKYLRADLEDICDRVCIQSSGKTAHEYGKVLMKSLKLLRCGQEDLPHAITYAGEKEFADIKRRVSQIAGFRPYRKRLCICMAAVAFMTMGITLLIIHTHSYARYNENKDIMVCKYDGEAAIVSNDTEYLSRLISYDDSYVYVDREAFESFLHQNNAMGDIYIVFGGYYKLPGMGGAAEACLYENNSTDRIVRIPYESIREHWTYILVKLL